MRASSASSARETGEGEGEQTRSNSSWQQAASLPRRHAPSSFQKSRRPSGSPTRSVTQCSRAPVASSVLQMAAVSKGDLHNLPVRDSGGRACPRIGGGEAQRNR